MYSVAIIIDIHIYGVIMNFMYFNIKSIVLFCDLILKLMEESNGYCAKAKNTEAHKNRGVRKE